MWMGIMYFTSHKQEQDLHICTLIFKQVVVFLEQICNNFTSKSNSTRINVEDGNLSSVLLM